MNITVIGSGYVGLVTGVCLASLGHQVICADTDAGKIERLAAGKAPIFEEGLEPLLREALAGGRIRFTAELGWAIQQSDVLFVAVGTPSLADGEADLAPLWSVVRRIAEAGFGTKLLVIKSTVPVGTCDLVEAELRNGRTRGRFVDVVHNPEFLRQGSAIADFMRPDRIVAGCGNEEARLLIGRLYAGIPAPVHYCDRRCAELIKYGANAFLAMKISFINMMADLSDKLDIDVDEAAAGIGADRRIGPQFLRSGVGYGGSCFPKDIRALRALGAAAGCELPLIEATEKINSGRPQVVVDKLNAQLDTLRGARIALFGLTFKAMTDDLREAPSLAVARLCLAEGASVRAYDPLVRDFPVAGVALYDDAYAAAEGCDAVVLLTEWDEFRRLDWGRIGEAARSRLLLDGRNMLSRAELRNIADDFGMTCLSVGRPALYPQGRTSPGVTPQYLRNTRVK